MKPSKITKRRKRKPSKIFLKKSAYLLNSRVLISACPFSNDVDTATPVKIPHSSWR
jgi:hypothetical protein